MRGTLTRRDVTHVAGLQLLLQGLTLVPYVDPLRTDFKAGKYPHWKSFPASPQTDEDRRRVEISTESQLAAALRADPGMNLAVLGVVQVDTDNDLAEKLAGDMGVSGADRAWFIRTRRGWRVVYGLPRHADMLRNVIKNGATQEEISAAKAGGQRLTELDLLINSPALVPPSIHPSGFAYRWLGERNPSHIPAGDLQEPPPLLLSHWENVARPRAKAAASSPLRQPDAFGRAIMELVESMSDGHGVRTRPNGWTTETRCPLGGHDADARLRFSVNIKLGAWKCWSKHGSGSLRELAELLHIDAPVHSRGTHGTVRSESRIA